MGCQGFYIKPGTYMQRSSEGYSASSGSSSLEAQTKVADKLYGKGNYTFGPPHMVNGCETRTIYAKAPK
jgi:hypothetical protein